MIRFNTWAIFDTTNEEYPGFYYAQFFKWQTPTDSYCIAGNMDQVRQWILKEAEAFGKPNMNFKNPPPYPYPHLLEIWY